ncbi:MAG: UDP-N-acetylmuramate--L-alanine ligase [Coraliomargarita sp.]
MRIYFMGICGTAMGNAALLLSEQGHDVFGADSGVYPPMCDVLADAGIEVFDGFDPERLAELAPDRVVIGNAMSRGNPEVEWMLNQSAIPFLSLPQLFHDELLPGRCPVVITGTHGKTTTSTLTAYLLEQAGQKPGWLIGGVPKDLPSGARLGQGAPFVIEGDEYDSAFFDKRSKFIHYRPQVAVLNNLEFDHGDIFRDLEDVLRTFRHFLRIIPGKGYALINGDDPNLATLTPVEWTRCIRVGTTANNDLQIANFSDGVDGSSFELIWKGKPWDQVNWPLHGLFNVRNAAMASLAAAFASGFEDPCEFSLDALSRFQGVARRQDILHEDDNWIVLEDFAHHPTAVAGAIEALRAAYPGKAIHACFEPRSNTAATARFQAEFTDALGHADKIYLGPVHRAERMKPEDRLDIDAMATELNNDSRQGYAFESNAALLEQLLMDVSVNANGLVAFFTNGSFDGIQRKLAESMA